MKEFVETLIGRLEEKVNKYQELADSSNFDGWHKEDIKYTAKMEMCEETIEIVNQLAEEYKDKVIIDGQYCWQTCSATEHCKECNRLCNGGIDYYENYDCLAEEYNNGWIPCEKKLPETNESVLCWAKSTARGGDVCFVGSYHKGFWFLQSSANTHSFPGQYKIVAWQPLPEPYQNGSDV